MSGYPLASVLAEKLVTMLEFRQANTRDRDVGDIVRIIATHTIDSDKLLSACRATARYRDIHLEPLTPPPCPGWPHGGRRRGRGGACGRGLQDELPESFADAVQAVVTFADPVLSGRARHATWHPQSRTWST